MCPPATPSSGPACPLPPRTALTRCGTVPSRRQTLPPAPRLATRNAAGSSRASAGVPVKSNSPGLSSHPPLVLIQKTAQFLQFLLRRSPALQRVNHQLACRALEHTLQDVTHQLPLRFRCRLACLVDVGALIFVSAHQPLCGHNLQKFENGGIPGRRFLARCFVDLARRGRSARPKNAKNLEFG